MPIITSIKPQKNGKRVNIYLDDKFGFGLDLQNYLKEGLSVNQELTTAQIEKIVKLAEFQSTYDKILRFATIRPRSESEFKIWLYKYKVHDSLTEELFTRLKRLLLLDDKKFSVWWVEQRKTFKPKSKRILELELRQKGIDKDIISEVLNEQNIDERIAAKKMIEKKKRLWDKLPEFEKRKKMFGYLMQHGFKSDLIRDLLGEIEEEFE